MNKSLDLTKWYPYIIAFGATILLCLLGVLIYTLIKRNRVAASYDEQLEELLADEFNDGDDRIESTKVSLIVRWNVYWARILQGSGISRYENAKNAGRDVAFAAVALIIIVSAITKNVIVGVVFGIVALWVVSLVIRARSNKKEDDLAMQLPGFLFSLKANMQASDTNERAMLKVIDSMPSPLYDDLLVVKNQLLANGGFKESLEELKEKTASRDLKFLCSCIIQASMSGANMINQIDQIQKVLESRKKVDDEIRKATKTVQPAIWLSSIVIPALFLASYFTDASARGWWFVKPMSWIAIGATAILYALGLFFVKRLVDSIKNM